MRYNTAEVRSYPAEPDGAHAERNASASVDGLSYARILRTIGHALETHRVVTCDITIENGIFTIKGRVRPAKKAPRSLFREMRQFFVKDSHTPRPDLITNRILLRYSMADIQTMEAQVRDHRRAAPEVPDPLCISQLLRVIGGFMDKRSGEELLGLWVDDRWVTITHVSRDKRLLKTTHDIEYFYDLWVKMYLRRSNRLSDPPPGGPTVCISGRSRDQNVDYLR